MITSIYKDKIIKLPNKEEFTEDEYRTFLKKLRSWTDREISKLATWPPKDDARWNR